jgi:phage tail sheath gpL-like
MASSIVILGWTSDDKVPGVYAETKFGQGRLSVGAFPVKVVVTGTKLSTGSATVDQDIVPVYSSDDAVTKLGPRSTATRQCFAALQIPGVNLYAAPPAIASGTPTAATMTLTFGGTWTSGGTVKLWIGGEYVEVNIGSTQVVLDAAKAAGLQVNSLPNGLVTAPDQVSITTGALIVTAANTGTQGNDILVYWDLSEAPTGLTITPTVGIQIHTRLYHLATGSGTESLANVIALLKTDVFDYIACAQNDSTNLGFLKSHMASEAGPTISHLEHMVCASTGSLVTASALSQTTLNDYRSTVLWYENCETHPSELAATVGAIRNVIEPTSPNYNYDDFPVPGAVPQRYPADKPLHATLKAALNSGLTPLIEKNGSVCIVRGIVSHCLNGSSPDYRCLDWGDAIVPDRVSKELSAEWVSVYKPANPWVGADAVGSEKDPVTGVGTPANWNSSVYGQLKQFENNLWIQDVDLNLPTTEYDNDRAALVSAVPIVVRKQQHAIGISVRQQAA